MITPESWPTDPRDVTTSEPARSAGRGPSSRARSGRQAPRPGRPGARANRPRIAPARWTSTAVTSLARDVNDSSKLPDRGIYSSSRRPESVALPPEPPVPESKTPARPRQSRKLDYDRLPQVRIEHDLPEADKSVRDAEKPKRASARTRHACWSSSRPILSFTSTSYPSTPVLAVVTASWLPRRLRVL